MSAPRSRSVTMLLLGLLLGAVAVAPVGANHNPQHTKRQIRALKKAVRSLKGRAATLEAGQADRYTKAEADDAFAESDHIVLSSTGHFEALGSSQVDHALEGEVLTRSSGSGTSSFPTRLDFPTELGGDVFELAGVEICYKVVTQGQGTKITETEIVEANAVLNGNELHSDPTDRTSTTLDCYTIKPAASIATANALSLNIRINGTGSDKVTITRVAATWLPV